MNRATTMNQTDRLKQTLAAIGVLASLLVVGCGTTNPVAKTFGGSAATRVAETRLRNGNQLQIRLDMESVANQPPQVIDTVIDENGEISLPLIGRIKAEGFTASELAERIQANYVPRYYVRCTATVLAATRFFYVGGEVRAPGRFNWTEDITLLKAINTAGGFTEFAGRRKVELSRGGEKLVFDYEDLRQHPSKDPAIQPGDSIYVPRSIF